MGPILRMRALMSFRRLSRLQILKMKRDLLFNRFLLIYGIVWQGYVSAQSARNKLSATSTTLALSPSAIPMTVAELLKNTSTNNLNQASSLLFDPLVYSSMIRKEYCPGISPKDEGDDDRF